MATMKDLLRAETLAGGARGAALDVSTYVSFTPPAKDGSVDFVAPCDGAVHVNGEYKTKDAWNSIWSRINNVAQTGIALGGSTGWIAFLTRVKKGDKVTVGNTGETSVSTTGFFKVIVGGINDTFRRCAAIVSEVRYGFA